MACIANLSPSHRPPQPSLNNGSGSAPGPPRVRRNWGVGVIDDSDHGLVTSSPRHQSAPCASFCPSRLRAVLRAWPALLARADEVIEWSGAISSRCSAARQRRGRSRRAQQSRVARN